MLEHEIWRNQMWVKAHAMEKRTTRNNIQKQKQCNNNKANVFMPQSHTKYGIVIAIVAIHMLFSVFIAFICYCK